MYFFNMPSLPYKKRRDPVFIKSITGDNLTLLLSLHLWERNYKYTSLPHLTLHSDSAILGFRQLFGNG